jgi:hypothetical protein
LFQIFPFDPLLDDHIDPLSGCSLVEVEFSLEKRLAVEQREVARGSLGVAAKALGAPMQLYLEEDRTVANVVDRMAIGMATGTETTIRVHANLALKFGATLDEITEVIRIVFFTCGVTKLLPTLEILSDLLEPVDESENN